MGLNLIYNRRKTKKMFNYLEKIPKKIFEERIDRVQIIGGMISMCSEDDFNKEQEGYRYNSSGIIEDWIGDNYYIIGRDSTLGDPIITDINDEKLPVYSMYSDDWGSLSQIASDYETFIKILKKIKEYNLNLNTTKEVAEKLIEEIRMIENKYIKYWEDLLTV